jgi:UDP-2,3-diacylglucosamine pyrophosphatase LpxH
MPEKEFDTLILSDVHLGSEVSRARDAVALLENTRYRRLILLGDIFSDLNFRRLTGDHWKFLSCIRKLSNPKRKIEVVWVEGNHDHGLSQIMSHLVGIPVYQRYVWEFAGLRHLAIHGHQFDHFVSRNAFISRFGELLYYRIQKLDTKSKRFSRLLDRVNTRWLRMEEKIANGALSFAKLGGIDRVFCGHTHVSTSVFRDGVWYYNTGSWVDARATYVTVDEEGVSIREHEPRIDNHYSIEKREPEPATAIELFEPARLQAVAVYKSVRC